MSAPIKSTPPPTPQPKPAPRVAPPADRPGPSESRPASPSTAKRGETERGRVTWQHQAADTPMAADGLFFSQLLIPPVSEEPSHSGFAGGSNFSMPLPAEGVPTQLIDELAQQLPSQAGQPFSVTLLMPNLGKVHVKANKRDSHWEIELGFARPDVLARLQSRQDACEEALSQALGHDVQLSLHDDFYS
ncbi:hypothetical protein ABH912_005445 [Pseudomonas sp. BT76 TE3572]|uniref:Uncharacterized protein n=1 Tax=Pseudomonas mandelii PD30 TaxID=1419583 RepID=A0A059KVV9_9PSED|nr:type III secretion system HrpP C-terminal domain-containing protein [Pseudomonas mandelii]KDD66126.1 hypothetical protein V466_25430 [Pseudomonas mandelii PD30]